VNKDVQAATRGTTNTKQWSTVKSNLRRGHRCVGYALQMIRGIRCPFWSAFKGIQCCTPW